MRHRPHHKKSYLSSNIKNNVLKANAIIDQHAIGVAKIINTIPPTVSQLKLYTPLKYWHDSDDAAFLKPLLQSDEYALL